MTVLKETITMELTRAEAHLVADAISDNVNAIKQQIEKINFELEHASGDETDEINVRKLDYLTKKYKERVAIMKAIGEPIGIMYYGY